MSDVNKVEYRKEITFDIFKYVETVDKLRQHEKIIKSKLLKKEIKND